MIINLNRSIRTVKDIRQRLQGAFAGEELSHRSRQILGFQLRRLEHLAVELRLAAEDGDNDYDDEPSHFEQLERDFPADEFMDVPIQSLACSEGGAP